jgi:glutaredoxin
MSTPRALLEATKGPLVVKLVLGSVENEQRTKLLELVERWSKGSPDLRLEVIELSEARATSLYFGETEESLRFRYSLVPEGPELLPFLRLVDGLTSGAEAKRSRAQLGLAALERALRLEVLAAPGCPHCPIAVGNAVELALANPIIELAVVDVLAEPELAEEQGVKSVPVVLIDGDLVFEGTPSVKALVERVLARGTARYAEELFTSLVKRGRHAQAAARLEGNERRFIESWDQSTMTERISLMLVAEEALTLKEEALDGLVEGLIPLLEHADASVRGDTVDLLGRIGHPEARAAMAALLDDPVRDVAEIAQDALDDLEEAGRQISPDRVGERS